MHVDFTENRPFSTTTKVEGIDDCLLNLQANHVNLFVQMRESDVRTLRAALEQFLAHVEFKRERVTHGKS